MSHSQSRYNMAAPPKPKYCRSYCLLGTENMIIEPIEYDWTGIILIQIDSNGTLFQLWTQPSHNDSPSVQARCRDWPGRVSQTLGITGGYEAVQEAATKFWFLKIQGNMASTKRGRHRGRTTVFICIKQLSFMLLVVQCLSQSPLELFQAKTPKKPWAKTEARKLHCCPQQIFAQKFPCSTCLCSRLCYNICNDCNDPCYLYIYREIYIYLLVIVCVFIL